MNNRPEYCVLRHVQDAAAGSGLEFVSQHVINRVFQFIIENANANTHRILCSTSNLDLAAEAR